MKYLKTFENMNNTPQIGDYVVCERGKGWSTISEDFNNYILNNVGKIISPIKKDRITMSYINKGYHYVKYFNVPDIFYWAGEEPTEKRTILNCWWDKENCAILIKNNDILYSSKNIEDLEILLQSNKYNL
jgi:hypothetical protein